MPIQELGHAGLWVEDLDAMRGFYTEMLGLTVTDEDPEKGIVFMSARPEEEHHELVIARGRTAPRDVKLVQQISFRVDTVESLLEFHRRFQDAGVEVQQEVTHGNAFGIYFWDPEGNRIEVYVRIPKDVRQPFRKDLNLDQSLEDVLAEADRMLAEGGETYGVAGGIRGPAQAGPGTVG
ncbi:VOC family protein [Nocardioides sp. cx-173]|uniref:VOC family protein n=1 Tax=Nocardioides sp. cx-173 TaxID=2898796 RepID=UPI001E4EF64D|nr:VOC family protein [Nocardioides sp. cx-173]MCD4526579.1 VOC family protein [Nocardioides sp. cx-173]UGB40674.1 VOC family protein [Nocardioides sp. cx-173]